MTKQPQAVVSDDARRTVNPMRTLAMRHEPLDETTREHLLVLIQANCAGRDDLYAAAETLSSKSLSMICRRLAHDLANNAIELQQIALAAGIEDVDAQTFGAQLQSELIEMIGARDGDKAVLGEAEECEETVERAYDQAIAKSDASAVGEVLERQREKVEFGKNVAHELQSAEEGDAS
jgi:uncharacterized protein (TIGR02284 family)